MGFELCRAEPAGRSWLPRSARGAWIRIEDFLLRKACANADQERADRAFTGGSRSDPIGRGCYIRNLSHLVAHRARLYAAHDRTRSRSCGLHTGGPRPAARPRMARVTVGESAKRAVRRHSRTSVPSGRCLERVLASRPARALLHILGVPSPSSLISSTRPGAERAVRGGA